MARETEGKVRAAVRGLPSEPVCKAGQEQAPGTSTGGDQDERWWRGLVNQNACWFQSRCYRKA